VSTSNVTKAKKFIIASVLDQARRDGISLTDIEIQMLGFAEGDASAKELEAAQIFERDYDDEKYEIKIAKLLRDAHDREKANEDLAAAWDYAVANLEDEDLYLKVILDLAGIGGSAPFAELVDRRLILAIAPAVILLAAGIVVGFTPIGARLIPNDTLRLALFLLLAVLPILLSKFRRKQSE
jgi:hypothetical protein